MIHVEQFPAPRTYVSCDGPGCTAEAPAQPGTDDFARVFAVGHSFAAGFRPFVMLGGGAGHLCPGCVGVRGQLALVRRT